MAILPRDPKFDKSATEKEDDLFDLSSFRYFWFSTREPKLLVHEKISFQLHLNLLSKNNLPLSVVEVHPHLWRVDIDHLKWDRGILEAARFADPFFHRQRIVKVDTTIENIYFPGGTDTIEGKVFKKGKEYRDIRKAGRSMPFVGEWIPGPSWEYLRKTLWSEVPVLNAEWFRVQSSRQLSLRNQQTGLGYADFLGFKNRDDYFKIVRFNQKDSEDLNKEVRSAVEQSGVSPTGRQLVRFGGGPTGYLWVALDTTDAFKNIAIEQIKRGQFKHQIEEWYAHLPNGLPFLGLFNNEGVRQNNAPADPAGFRDDSPLNESRDGRIHLGTISCLGCHAGAVLRDIDDHIRATKKYPVALGEPIKTKEDKRKFEELQEQYFSDLGEALEDDKRIYLRAFQKATVTPWSPKGLTAQKAVTLYAQTYHAYATHPVTLDTASRELGTSRLFLKEALQWKAGLRPDTDPSNFGLTTRLDTYLDDKSHPLHRLTWEASYADAQDILMAYALQKKAGKP